MHLCYLKRSDHFRLCSSVFGALLQRKRIPTDDVKKVNYVIMDGIMRCEEKLVRIISDKFLEVKATPCAFSRKPEDAQFYVLPDLREAASVFVFTREVEHDEEILITAKVVNIHVLYGVDYHAPPTRMKPGVLKKRNQSDANMSETSGK